MISKLQEFLRWIIFIPLPFIAGPVVSSLLLLLLLVLTKGFGGDLVDIPGVGTHHTYMVIEKIKQDTGLRFDI